jgi:hypothetical protein
MKPNIPGFLPISKAVAQLEAGMFGNLPRTEAVVWIKSMLPDVSVGSGPQRETAAAAIYTAALAGKLAIFALPASPVDEPAIVVNSELDPFQIPTCLLKKFIRSHGGLPDHVLRLPVQMFKESGLSPNQFRLLSTALLVIDASEFDAWYQKQCARAGGLLKTACPVKDQRRSRSVDPQRTLSNGELGYALSSHRTNGQPVKASPRFIDCLRAPRKRLQLVMR